MVTIQSSRLRSFLSLLISGVVVPVLVHAFTEARTGGEGSPTARLVRSCFCLFPGGDADERVTAQGVGLSEEAAWRDAMGSALRTAVSPLVDAQTWARDGRFICASVLGDGQGLITRCQDLGCTWDRGSVRREVAVFVDRAALVGKLRAAHVRVVGEVGLSQ